MPHQLQIQYNQHKRLVWIIAGLIVCHALAGFVVVPLVVQHMLVTKAARQIHRSIRVDRVYFNPYTFSLKLRDLSVNDPDGGAFVHIKAFAVNAQPVASLFSWGVAIKAIIIDSPDLRVMRQADGQFNFSDLLLKPSGSDQDSPDQPASTPRLKIKRFALEDGRLAFIDSAVGAEGKPFQTTLNALTFTVDYLDTKAGVDPALYRFAGRSDAGESFEVQGRIDITALDVSATFGVDHLQLSRYSPYYQPMLAKTIDGRIADGTLLLKGNLQWSNDRQLVENLHCGLNDFTLSALDGDQMLIRIPTLELSHGQIDLTQQQITIGQITTTNGEAHIVLDANSKINLLAAAESESTAAPSPGQSVAETDASPATPGGDLTGAPPWRVVISQLNLDSYTIGFRDESVSPGADVKLSQITMTAQDLQTARNATGSAALSLNWAEQGTLAVQGKIGLVPLLADMDVSVRDMDLRPLQPYLNSRVRLLLTQGDFATQGRLQLESQDKGMDIQYSGQASVNRFEALDTNQSSDFLKWGSFSLSGLTLGSAPLRVHIEEVGLTDFYSRLAVFKDGTTNISGLLVGSGEEEAKTPTAEDAEAKEPAPTGKPETPAAPNKDAPDISVKRVILQGGRVDFTDEFVKPNVNLPMTAVAGRISGLNTLKTDRADVLLQGKVRDRVPLEIRGKINPLIDQPYINLTLDFAPLDLSPFSPYSEKYLGYTLDKGQLSLDLSYLVENNKLVGRNKVVLNRLTLGDSVDSPDATKLPVKLAIALLQNSQGVIDLDLEAAGNLDDPEFSIGGIILKMVVNLIVKIVSSPFKMLGALFGGGEELEYLDFDPGVAAMTGQDAAKLDTLAKILADRPGLSLELEGQVNADQDADALRRMRFERTLKVAKLNAMVAAGQAAIPVEQVTLAAEERDGLIASAYAAATFPKPKDENGQVKQLPGEEMEKLLYAAIEITPDDLRLLAHSRASAAKDYLAETAGVAPNRMFILEPDVEAGTADSQVGHSRVKFGLKSM